MITVENTLSETLEARFNGATLCITHGGIFHADEVLATAVLERVFGDVVVMRVNEVPAGLPAGAIVYDIGGGDLDHHQLGGNGSREDGTPYASAGLVWREYGMRVLEDFLSADEVWAEVDKRLFAGVDAVDNGSAPKNLRGCSMSLSQVISGFNPVWDSRESANARFLSAVAFMSEVLENSIQVAASRIRARGMVESALSKAEEGIMVLDKFAPWRDAFFAAAPEKSDGVKFVVYPALRGGFNWQTVSKNACTREARCQVPQSWCGLQGTALRQACGIPQATFCHPAGFMGAAETKDGAIAMAREALAR